MKIYCTGCNEKVEARLTNGAEIYPHREDLAELPFWKCDVCQNYVGCHYKTGNPTNPLGCIPTKEITAKRKQIHALLDPLWRTGKFHRGELYNAISGAVGFKYHTAETRSVEEADKVIDFLKKKYYRESQLPL